ncbi:MAG: short-chain fatty acids transporter [Flavobacteriales bacterium]|jgi:short-chain fatty acids transporter
MKEFSDRFIRVFSSFLPAPFTIAVALIAIVFLVAFFSSGKEFSASDRGLNLLSDWETGMWKPSLLVCAFQMILMLVLGHVRALFKPAERVITLVSNSISTSTSRAAFFICLQTIFVGFFNWGFGLLFGAILARKVGENAFASNRQIN